MARLVVFAAHEALDPRRTGVGAEAHRPVLRAAEEDCRVAFVRKDRGELAARAERLRHQHEGGAERRDAAQHRGHGLDRPRAVGVHASEAESVAHQRIEERRESFLGREALGFPTGINLRHQIGRMLGRHALHDENHDVAPRKIDRRRVGGHVYGGEPPPELFGREVFAVADAARAAHGAEDAEGVAQDEIRLRIVRSVERGVREGDRACHAGKSAACASDAEAGGEQEDRRAARVVGPAAAQEALLADAAAVAPRQQRRQREPRQHQIPVLGHELPVAANCRCRQRRSRRP